MYYGIEPGWLIRTDWDDYLAFHARSRAMFRLNRPAYVVLHALIGRSVEEAFARLSDQRSLPREDLAFLPATADELVANALLFASERRPRVPYDDLEAMTAPSIDLERLVAPGLRGSYYETPASVLWSLTNRCNLRCTYCAPASGSKASPDLSADDLGRIEEELAKNRVFEVILTGGEALLRRQDALNLLARLSKRRHFVHLLSNGTLMREAIADQLADLQIGIGISLDGPTEAVNCITRGRGNFRSVTKAIRLLTARGVWTNVLTVLTRFSIEALDELFPLLHGLGVKYLVLQPLRPSGRGKAVFESLRPTPAQLREIPLTLERLKMAYPEINVDDFEVRSWGELARIGEREALSLAGSQNLLSCGAGVRFCVVNAEGQVAPCNALLDFPCGTLLRQPLEAIWHDSEILQDLRILATKSARNVPYCSSCPLSAVCDGGCRADAYHATGSWLGLHPYCLAPLSGNAPELLLNPSASADGPTVRSESSPSPLSSLTSH